MMTCAFIVCVLQIAACGNNLRNTRLSTSYWLGNLTGLALAGTGAIGLTPYVF